MKKISLSLAALVAAVSMEAQTNSLYIKVGESETTSKIPVNIYMTNEAGIIGLQASYALPTGLTQENSIYDNDNKQYVALNSERCDSEFSKYKVEMFTNSKPNDLLLSVTAGATDKAIAAGDGLIGTFYFDGSSLTDGTYEVAQYTATIFPSASERIDIDSRTTSDDDLKASFTVKDGKVIGTTTGINSIVSDDEAADGIYNIAGQRLNAPQKGLNIVGGKKVLVK